MSIYGVLPGFSIVQPIESDISHSCKSNINPSLFGHDNMLPGRYIRSKNSILNPMCSVRGCDEFETCSHPQTSPHSSSILLSEQCHRTPNSLKYSQVRDPSIHVDLSQIDVFDVSSIPSVPRSNQRSDFISYSNSHFLQDKIEPFNQYSTKSKNSNMNTQNISGFNFRHISDISNSYDNSQQLGHTMIESSRYGNHNSYLCSSTDDQMNKLEYPVKSHILHHTIEMDDYYEEIHQHLNTEINREIHGKPGYIGERLGERILDSMLDDELERKAIKGDRINKMMAEKENEKRDRFKRKLDQKFKDLNTSISEDIFETNSKKGGSNNSHRHSHLSHDVLSKLSSLDQEISEEISLSISRPNPYSAAKDYRASLNASLPDFSVPQRSLRSCFISARDAKARLPRPCSNSETVSKLDKLKEKHLQFHLTSISSNNRSISNENRGKLTGNRDDLTYSSSLSTIPSIYHTNTSNASNCIFQCECHRHPSGSACDSSCAPPQPSCTECNGLLPHDLRKYDPAYPKYHSATRKEGEREIVKYRPAPPSIPIPHEFIPVSCMHPVSITSQITRDSTSSDNSPNSKQIQGKNKGKSHLKKTRTNNSYISGSNDNPFVIKVTPLNIVSRTSQSELDNVNDIDCVNDIDVYDGNFHEQLNTKPIHVKFNSASKLSVKKIPSKSIGPTSDTHRKHTSIAKPNSSYINANVDTLPHEDHMVENRNFEYSPISSLLPTDMSRTNTGTFRTLANTSRTPIRDTVIRKAREERELRKEKANRLEALNRKYVDKVATMKQKAEEEGKKKKPGSVQEMIFNREKTNQFDLSSNLSTKQRFSSPSVHKKHSHIGKDLDLGNTSTGSTDIDNMKEVEFKLSHPMGNNESRVFEQFFSSEFPTLHNFIERNPHSTSNSQ